MRPLVLCLAIAVFASAQDETEIHMASTGRLLLRGPMPLENIQTSAGSAKQEDNRTEISFPARWWSWRELTVCFTPSADGQVELVLDGPWTEEESEGPRRQEILWDDLRMEGAEIYNGGFEKDGKGVPEGWSSPSGPYPSPGAWPLAGSQANEGKKLAASWQDRPLSQTFPVKAGQEVTLVLQAKAATPPDFVVPKKLPNDSPAHKAVAKIKRGVNLGNCWEAPPPYSWGIRYTAEDIDRIAAEGFDHIRIPIAWHFHLKGQEISPALLADLEPVIRHALEKKMHVLVDWHHFHDLTSAPSANKAKFIAGWEVLARHFKDWPPEVFLELLNEPRDALTTEAVNVVHAETIAAIRKIDPTRILLVSTGNWGNISEIDKLRLPDHDDRLVVTVHSYEPYYFTHQRADWTGLRALRNITYPGPPPAPVELPASLKENSGVRNFLEGYNSLPADRNPCGPHVIREMLDLASEWSAEFGRPVHLGEFGAINSADPASRARYTKDVRIFAEERQMPWTLWDWKARFGYWNSRSNSSDLRDALFK